VGCVVDRVPQRTISAIAIRMRLCPGSAKQRLQIGTIGIWRRSRHQRRRSQRLDGVPFAR